MPSTFFTSDSHFAHKRIIEYSKRPFSCLAEHDEILVDNWNRDVKPGDTVYFLGDFAYGNKDYARSIRNRLNGNIHFIKGNHDATAHQIRQSFIWFKDVHEITVNFDQKVWLSHYAHRTWPKSHHGVWHLYGHSHGSLKELPDSLSMDVGVDMVALRASGFSSGDVIQKGWTKPEDYRPIHWDEIVWRMKCKKFVPIDHHE